MVQKMFTIWLFSLYQAAANLNHMDSRREIIQAGFAGLFLAAVGFSERAGSAEIKTIYRMDLPPVSLDRWEVTVLDLTFPPGISSSKHVHSGFVLGYVLEGELRFQVEGEQERVLSAGEVFFEPPGAVQLTSASASATKPARILALAFGQKGKELTRRL